MKLCHITIRLVNKTYNMQEAVRGLGCMGLYYPNGTLFMEHQRPACSTRIEKMQSTCRDGKAHM